MTRGLIISASFALLLAGCDRVERRTEEGASAWPNTTTTFPAATPQAAESTNNYDLLAAAAGGKVNLGAMRLQAPETWVRKKPRNSFIMAEFSLPRAEGDTTDARLTLSVAGGSVQANVDRWRQQFSGKAESDSQQQREIAGLKVTLVDFSGTFRDQPGPFAPATELAGHRMLGAIIAQGGKLHFIKCYGPEKTIAEHADEFHAFVQSLEAAH